MEPFYIGSLVLNSISSGITAGIKAKTQAAAARYQYESASLRAGYQAEVARLNAQVAASDLVTNQLAMERNAAVQGMQAAKSMAGMRASMASSGVYMNSASKYEVQASQRFSHAVDLSALRENQTHQLGVDQNKIVSYLGQTILQEAAAKANSTLAGTINPGRIGLSTAFNTMFEGLGKLAADNAFNEIDVSDVDLGAEGKKSPDYGVDVVHDPTAFSTKLSNDYTYYRNENVSEFSKKLASDFNAFGGTGSNLTKFDYDYFGSWVL